MDTEEYSDSSMDSSCEEVEEEEEHDYYYDEHECKKCTKCEADRSYVYVATIKPVSFSGVPTLMHMASVSAAVSLWRHVNITHAVSRIRRKCTKDSDKWEALFQKVTELPEKLPVPDKMHKMMKENVVKMKNRIINWVSYHFRTVFLKKGQDNILYSLVYQIIWHPNGEINCEQTARNMQTSLRLSDVEKFKFLCTYCLKDDIEKMSPSLFESVVLDFVNFSEYPLIYYWYCYYRNEMNKIPVTGNVSLDCFMFRLDKVDNWSAKQYFFDRMNSEEQKQQAIWIIDKHNVTYQNLVLSKLNEVQRLYVCSERPVKIMTYYARTKINSKELLSTWCEIRDWITGITFVKIFTQLLKASTVDTILTDIWCSASEHLKQYLLSHENHAIVNAVLSEWGWSNDSEFIFNLLQSADHDTRKSILKASFFTEYIEKLLADRGKFSRFERFLNLCLPEVRESMQFKKNLSNSKNIMSRCLYYYKNSNLNGVNDLLNLLFSSDTSSILEYKKTLLMTSDDWPEFLFTDVWNSVSDNYKNYLLYLGNHTVVNYVLNSTRWINDEEFVFAVLACANDTLKKTIVQSETFTRYALDLLRDQNTHYKFEKLLKVCITDDQEALQYKNQFSNLDHVQSLCLKYYTSGKTKEVNDLLNLLFSSDTNSILQYQKSLMNSPKAMDMFIGRLCTDYKTLNVIIAHALPDTDFANKYKKQMMFWPTAVQKMKEMMYKKRFKVVQNCVDTFLISKEDKIEFKELLISNPEQLVRDILRKCDESYCQTLMLWYCEDESSLQRFKEAMNVNAIFNELLTASVFDTFDVMLGKCKFKYVVDFEELDRFLKWFFQSPSHVKQFKIAKIDSFQQISMITTLMRKKDQRCLKKVMAWFFQGDAAEISKFKAKWNYRSSIVQYV